MKLKLLLSVVTAIGLCAQTSPAPAKTKPGSSKPSAAKPATPAKPVTSPAPTAAKTAPGTSADPAAAPKTAPGGGAPAAPVDPNKVVLTIGTEKITAKDFDAILESLPEPTRAQVKGPAKRQFAEQFVRMRLLAQEGQKRGLDKQTRVRLQMENTLAAAAFNDIATSAPVDEPALRKMYEEGKNQYENVQARHILIRFKGSPVPLKEGAKEMTEEEALAKAQEVRKRLQAGEDFAKIAKEVSDDTGSGANGGDLGTFGRGQMVGEFEKAAFALPVGQLSEPVKSQFGYHVIKVEKHDTKTFEQVRPELEQKLRPEMARRAVEKMRTDTPVSLDDSYFGAAQPAPASAGAPPAGQQQ